MSEPLLSSSSSLSAGASSSTGTGKRTKLHRFDDVSPKSVEQIKELIADDEKVKVAGTDVDGILRGKVMSKKKFLSILSNVEKGFGFCGVVFGWDMHDNTYDEHVTTGIGEGYGDVSARIDLNTFRRIPWQRGLPIFLVDFLPTAPGNDVCPRSLLKRVLSKYEEDGYVAKAGVEFEFFNFRETPLTVEEKKHRDLTALTPGQFGYSVLRQAANPEFFEDCFNLMAEFGIPIEGLHTETGPGVYEAAIEYSDALLAADRGQLFKTAIKEIGLKHGVMPSFMAKPYFDQPGCGGHIHYSLWDSKQEKNLFWDANDPRHMSKLFKQFLAGIMRCLPDILPMFCPNVNSYKRIVEKMWAPVVLSWGVENRTSSCRVINDSEKAIRIEVRVGGADINCYNAIAAVLAAGLYGIRNQLELQPETPDDNLKDKSIPRLSKDLKEATAKMQARESLARDLFGDYFVDHYTATRRFEWMQYANAVTDWELRRYFELA